MGLTRRRLLHAGGLSLLVSACAPRALVTPPARAAGTPSRSPASLGRRPPDETFPGFAAESLGLFA